MTRVYIYGKCIYLSEHVIKDVAREARTRAFPVLRAKIPASSRVRAASESAGMAILARIPAGIPPDSPH